MEWSWEEGAVLRERAGRMFARPDKVHRIRHDDTYFQIEAIHLCNPSPQRTPLLYQAARPREAANSPRRTPNAFHQRTLEAGDRTDCRRHSQASRSGGRLGNG
jgi:alkanesulfonate monooxygenase SsuD/methylene tetrahydromethanopterin reductase-like flavin-dependent oxidoreductase (luciferase family)